MGNIIAQYGSYRRCVLNLLHAWISQDLEVLIVASQVPRAKPLIGLLFGTHNWPRPTISEIQNEYCWTTRKEIGWMPCTNPVAIWPLLHLLFQPLQLGKENSLKVRILLSVNSYLKSKFVSHVVITDSFEQWLRNVCMQNTLGWFLI